MNCESFQMLNVTFNIYLKGSGVIILKRPYISVINSPYNFGSENFSGHYLKNKMAIILPEGEIAPNVTVQSD